MTTDTSGSGRRKKVNIYAEEEEGQSNARFTEAMEMVRQQVEGGATPPGGVLSSKPVTQKALRSSSAYTKVTYRLSNEAVQAAEDMKALLKRRYGFKRVNLEEIVEEALLAAQRDLEEHQEQGFLVQQLRQHKNPVIQ
jgi:hypothetical protein